VIQRVQQAPSIRLAPVEVAMKRSAPHLSDQVLTRCLVTAIVQESNATAMVLDHIAEFDARRLYRAAGYSSMFAYCVEKLHCSEDATYKRIQAARAANRFPAIFDLVADRRLHLSAVCLLAPHLTEDTAGELLAAATHRARRRSSNCWPSGSRGRTCRPACRRSRSFRSRSRPNLPRGKLARRTCR